MKPEHGAVPFEIAVLPPALVGLFEHCARAGLYGDADRQALVEMYRLDPRATLDLVADMATRVLRCRRCAHFRRPGASDGYCVGRDDLPHAYGLLRHIPSDGGAWCSIFRLIDVPTVSQAMCVSARELGHVLHSPSRGDRSRSRSNQADPIQLSVATES